MKRVMLILLVLLLWAGCRLRIYAATDHLWENASQFPTLLGERRIALLKDGQANITIVCGKEHVVVAQRLQDRLAQALGVRWPITEDVQVLAPRTWRLANEWASKNLLLMGNIHTNRAIMALYGRVLADTSARYPGPGRYEIRTIFAPFRREADILLLGASDEVGLEAGVERLVHLIHIVSQKHQGQFTPLIEFGTGSGPDRPVSRAYKEFYEAAAGLYWYGDLRAGAQAREMVLKDIAARPHGIWGFDTSGHYSWEGHYRGLLQLMAAGIFSEEERRRIDERLTQNALENTDPYGISTITRDSESVTLGLDRHLLSAVVAQYVLLEYLDNVGYVPPQKKDKVLEKHMHVRNHIEAFLQRGRFRARNEGSEGLDCVTALAGIFLHYGDERALEKNIFRNMADYYIACVDNLGYQVGQDSYITCRPGCHYAGTSGGLGVLAAAYFYRDGQYRWIAENMSWFRAWSFLRVCMPPELFSLPESVPPIYPSRYVGVSTVPMDPVAYEVIQKMPTSEALVPFDHSYDCAYSKAILRDGFAPQDAFMMLQTINSGAYSSNEGYQGNSIVRYTELESLLLFHNTQRQTSWARNVVSTSRGMHDPQACACVLETKFSSPLVSGVSSLFSHDGGVAWRRSIVRRHHGYFVVLDEMTASAEDTYNFTCRWRSFHTGRTEGTRIFRATDGMNGTTLNIISAEPLAQSIRLEPRDGAAEPTILRQQKRVCLKKGQSAAFRNLLYATNDAVRRDFDIRPLHKNAVLVKGQCKDFEEIAAVGTHTLAPLRMVSGTSTLWYFSNHGLVASGARKISLRGLATLESADDFNLMLFFDGRTNLFENPGRKPIQVTLRCEKAGVARIDSKSFQDNSVVHLLPGVHKLELGDISAWFADATRELDNLWQKTAKPEDTVPLHTWQVLDPWRVVWRYEELRPPLAKHHTIKASAEPPTTVGEPSAWVDRRIHYIAPSAGWKSGVQGAAILDLYQEVNIIALRVVGSQGYFKEGEMAFEVVLSNDAFTKDQRKLSFPTPRYETYYAEMAHYMYTYQFPMYVLPIGERARHVKIIGHWLAKKEPVLLHEIEVITAEPEPMTKVRIFVDDFWGNKQKTVLAAAGSRLVMLSSRGEKLWEVELESPFTNVNLADVNSDGKKEILVFTLAEKLHVYNPDGTQRFIHDARKGYVGGHTELRPAAMGAWRPDAKGNMEYYFLPHVRYVRVSPEPELSQHSIALAGGALGGKHAFTVPDVTGDGKDDLAIVGLYGMGFGVVDSRDDLTRDQIRYFILHGLTGHSSGNMELPVYFDGGVARTTDAKAKWLGVVALNPGGVNFFSAPKLSPVWSHFNHAPNTCYCLLDLTGDSVPELLVGREDGFVTQYALNDGAVMNKVYAGGEVRALAAADKNLLVATNEGLLLLDDNLRPVGFKPGAAQAVALMDGITIIAHDTGAVMGLHLEQIP